MKKYIVLGFVLMMTVLAFYSCKEDYSQPTFQEEKEMGEVDVTQFSPKVQNFFQFDYASKQLSNSRNQYLITLDSQTYEFRPSTVDAYNEVTLMIYHQELQKPFLEQLIQEDGYPIWDRSINFTGANAQMFYIVPFARKNEAEISSILAVTRHLGQVKFHYWKKSDLRQLLAKDQVLKSDIEIVEITLAANSWTFGAREEILDRILVELKQKPQPKSRCEPIYVEAETFVWVPCSGPIAKITQDRYCGEWVSQGVTQIFVGLDCGGGNGGGDGSGDGSGDGGDAPGDGWPGGETPPTHGGGGDGSTNEGGSSSIGNHLGWQGTSPISGGLGDGGKGRDLKLYLIPEFKDYQYAFNINERKWILDNSQKAKLKEFFSRPEFYKSSKIEAAQIYVRLMMQDEDFATFANTEFNGMPGFLWPMIREIGIEVAIELIKKHVPGVSDYQNVIDAINSAQQGDILGFLAEVIDIVKKKFPALAAIDLAIDGYNLFSKAAKAWRAIVKMEKFGSDVIEKLLITIKNHSGNILGKFKWEGGNVGARLLDINSPEGFWDEFDSLFPVNPPYVEKLSASELQPQELARFKLNSGQIRVVIKYGGNTTPNNYTIEFKHITNYTFKIRIN